LKANKNHLELFFSIEFDKLLVINGASYEVDLIKLKEEIFLFIEEH